MALATKFLDVFFEKAQDVVVAAEGGKDPAALI